MKFDELKAEVDAGAIDTVVLAMTDMQGRLQGKRLSARHFLGAVAEHGAEACSYLLAVDVEMRTVDGYGLTSWSSGYGDFVLVPDLTTLCALPWHERSALCLADAHADGGAPIEVSPRQVLRRQLARLAERGWTASTATELEFIVFNDSYEEAHAHGYRELTHASRYNADYSLLGTSRVEPLLRRIRTSMEGAGMEVEASKGECDLGQHEITFRYADALTTCDRHVIFKTGAKEIADQAGMAITFMAKFDEREGNGCHVHLSLRDDDGTPVLDAQPEVLDGFLGGMLAALPELTLLLAPNVNSYKRFRAGTFAPTAIAWGRDNRTCALRVVGDGPSLRVECRVPGADANPYLAVAALLAGGLHGVDAQLRPGAPQRGNAYAAAAAEHLPATLRDARDRFSTSDIAHAAFGTAVVEHYLNAAHVELAAFDETVTDWERRRGFERL